jgi:hypothetical protein
VIAELLQPLHDYVCVLAWDKGKISDPERSALLGQAASGHVAAPLMSVMNSRRFILPHPLRRDTRPPLGSFNIGRL